MIKRIGIGLCFIGVLTPGTTAGASPLPPISLPEYKQELERLHTVVEDCAQELASKTTPPKACDPALVGPDEIVSTASGKRIVEYDWLRDSLRQAGQSSKASKQARDAGARLGQMSQEIASPPATAMCLAVLRISAASWMPFSIAETIPKPNHLRTWKGFGMTSRDGC